MPSSAAEAIELFDGERIEHDVRPAWSKWSGLIIVSIMLTPVLVGFAGLAYVWLVRRNTRYIVTNYRVLEVTGLLGSRTTEYQVDDIREIHTDASLSEQIFGQGNLQISTGTMDAIVFDGIPEYQNVANTIRQAKREAN